MKLLAILVLLVAACGDDSGDLGLDGGTGPVSALFEIPRGGPISEFYALPFPNDLRIKSDGTIDLDQHVRPNVFAGFVIDIIAKNTPGFGTNQTIFTRYSGALAESSLPADAAATVTDGASVYVVNVDPDSAELGKKSPLWIRFKAREGYSIGANALAAMPYPGFPLRGSTTYAFVVTRRLKGSDGTPVKRSADFTALMGTGTGDAAVVNARSKYAPLLTWLDGTGSKDKRDDVVSAAVFTTQDPTSLMGKLRQVTFTLPEPAAAGVHSTGSASASFKTFEGTYQGPNFQKGDPPYITEGGYIELDGAGLPIVQRMEPIRFAATFPKTTPPPEGWPVVVYAHGTGGDYRSFIREGVAARLTAEGLACISIDQVLHGPRDPTGTNPEITYFNIYNPLGTRDNGLQGAADDFQLMRLVKLLTIEDGQLTHRYNTNKIYFFGHSQGGLTGPPFLAFEPDVKAAVLSGAGSVLAFALLYKTYSDAIDLPGIVASFVRDNPIDEHNNIFGLLQMFAERADPINYAAFLLREPLPGVGAKDIFQSEGLVDTEAPIQGIEALGLAIGLSPVAPILRPVPQFALRDLTTLNAPVMSNVLGKSAVFLQYMAPPGVDGHFVIFRVPAAQSQSAKFLGSMAKNGVATLPVP